MKSFSLHRSLFLYLACLYVLFLGVFLLPSIREHIAVSGQVKQAPKKQIAIQQPKLAIQEVKASTQEISGTPIRIVIPKVGIDLPIIQGGFVNGNWILTDDKVQFATMTSLPNNVAGDTLLYAHDTIPLFYPTINLQKGDMLYVYTSNNHVFTYMYQGDDFVLPTDTSILTYEGPSRVTLLTCNGVFDEYRRLMYFSFVKVQ